MSIIEKVLDKMDRMDKNKSTDKHHGDSQRGNNNSNIVPDRLPDDSEIKKTDSKKKPEYGNSLSNNSRKIEIDFERLKKFGILTPNTINLTLSEQYRRIKRPILTNAFDKDSSGLKYRNLVMVTSSIPGEGKSFTSCNLAMSITKEFNNTVLFIDADISKQTVTNNLGLSKYEGLTDYVIDEKRELADFLLKTDIQNLTILPAGKSYDKTTELWASDRMFNLMNELSQRYKDRLVIFDSPPVLQDSSACMLARIVGQIIMVVEAEKTPQHILKDALNTLAGSQYIGLVLNKSNQRLTSEYGYYAYT